MKRRYFGLTSLEKDICLHIAVHGGLTKYDLASKLGKTYSSVDGSVGRLERRGMLKVLSSRPARTGLPMRTYGLTIRGLCFTLLRGEGWKNVKEIINSNRNLVSLVLGKWDHFRREGVEEFALDQLKFATRYVCDVVESPLLVGGEPEPTTGDAKLFTTAFYEPRYVPKTHREILKWFHAIGKDQEIRAFIEKLLDHDSEEYRKWLERNDEIRHALKGGLKKAPSRGRR